MKCIKILSIFTSKHAEVERATDLEPPVKGDSVIKVSVPSKYQQYMTYKATMITA